MVDHRPVRLAAALGLALTIALLVGPAGADEPAPSPSPWPAAPVVATTLTPGTTPSISGRARYRQELTASPGLWRASGLTFTYRWYRDGERITGQGSTGRTRTMTHRDVGKRMSVRVTATKPGHLAATGPMSERTAAVRHLRDPRRTVTYSVVNDGSRLDMASVRRQVAGIYADARGWRKGAVRFRQVTRGGDFTVVLAEAQRLPRYSSVCSVRWSCRVGRHVIVNEDRWRSSTRAWRAAGKSVASYRHMVVNHETGHWFGFGHQDCSGRGRAAPVMQQQSKELQGCRANPFPLDAEARRLVR